jgi:hypothetical protein
MKALICAIAACMTLVTGATGHSGGLDKLGCHSDRRRDNYHCHRGPLAGRTFRSKAEAQRELERQRQRQPAENKKEEEKKSR